MRHLTIVAGDIGDDQREVEFEPLTAPAPLTVPAEPAPAPLIPEAVPA